MRDSRRQWARTRSGLYIAELELPRGVRRFMPAFQAPFQSGFAAAGGAPVVPWWLSGGISAASCIAAYQAKAAASLAASKVNLANPGTFNLVGAAASWAAATGWAWAGGTAIDGYNTGFTQAATNWSFLLRVSGMANPSWYAFGSYTANSQMTAIRPVVASTDMIVANANQYSTQTGAATAAGVIILAGQKLYINGVFVANLNAASSPPVPTFYIGRANGNTTLCTGNVLAAAAYNYDISTTPGAIVAVSAAATAI